MLKPLRHWKTHVRDALELALLPGLAAVLPWRLCFALFKRFARWPWLYRTACDAALREALARGQIRTEQAADWIAQRRLVTLLDHADLYLALTRSNAWMYRHLHVEGQWPSGELPGIVCTFHWGAGMWSLRHAKAQGMRCHALVAPLEGAHFAGRPILHRYAQIRTAAVATALGNAHLDVSASLRPGLRALSKGEQILAAIDVPADQVAASIPVTIGGMQAMVPKGLLRMAVEQRIPVTIYLTRLDLETGDRFLRIISLGVADNLESLAQQAFSYLDEAITMDSAAWHFWSEAPRFFTSPPIT